MNEKSALEIFGKYVPVKADSVERCGVGHGNYVYIISGGAKRYVVRCSSEDNAYTETIYWLRRLRKVNIPVPEIIGDGRYQDFSYIILSYLEGRDLGLVYPALSREEKQGIAREVVRIQKLAASIELGDIKDRWNWKDSFVQYMLDRARERIEKNDYFDVDKIDRLWQMGETLEDYFLQIKPIAYLDDISTKNLLIDQGRVSGIIDVDWIGIGDRLTFVAMSNVALLNKGYDTDYINYLMEELDVSQVERKALVFYSLLYCVDFMGERGMQFGDKVVDVNETVVRRLNQIYDDLIIEWYKKSGG